MNRPLNEQNNQAYHTSPHLFCGDLDVMANAIDEQFIQRKNQWLMFLEAHRNAFLMNDLTLQALEIAFEKNDVLIGQTAIEFELSKDFYASIFSVKRELYFSNLTVAHKLLSLSLIFGKYPGMFRHSFVLFFQKSELEITEKVIDTLIKHVLVRYETPHYLIQNINHLNNLELHLFMQALNGKNLRKSGIFPVRPTKNEFSKIMQLNAEAMIFSNHLFVRGLVFVKLEELKIDKQTQEIKFSHTDYWTTGFLKSSSTFINNPEQYLRDIEFWMKACVLVMEITAEYIDTAITDCVDYLEFMKYHSGVDFSLKGRTMESLRRSIDDWHLEEVFKIDYSNIYDLKWEGINDMDLFITHEKFDYSFTQLKSGEELYHEGQAMKNCVLTYTNNCYNGKGSIWSMKIKRKEHFQPILTLEVIEKEVVQARQKWNALPSKKQLDVVRNWANRLGYKMNLYKNE